MTSYIGHRPESEVPSGDTVYPDMCIYPRVKKTDLHSDSYDCSSIETMGSYQSMDDVRFTGIHTYSQRRTEAYDNGLFHAKIMAAFEILVVL